MFASTLGRLAPKTRKPNLLTRIIAADTAYRQRRSLQRLTDAQLADAGLDRNAVAAQRSQSLWNSPAHWRQ
ncbi:DUF1127 domain-containing protein [Loktanella sp. SALINAS62]|uniref:DUF1127 domain-containing protein n=1 Tax=Loktanella sp. SALINAS62 TaxID=2706124 RepID=UPI001B8B6036|nr:DUF1127 domain-containing protein [Loktanella sp. SALINAS62]MBS1303166.1 DUF1127 domain-containing protein [Loktanella sp. SALINAS62]